MSSRKSLSSSRLLPPRPGLRNATSLMGSSSCPRSPRSPLTDEHSDPDPAGTEPSTSDSESTTSENSLLSPRSSSAINLPLNPLIRKAFGDRATKSSLWPTLFDFERCKTGRELITEAQEVEISLDEWNTLVVYLTEHVILLKIFSFHYNPQTLKLYMSSVTGIHQHLILLFCALTGKTLGDCVCKIGDYEIFFGSDQLKSVAGPIVDPYQTVSTIHIPDIVVKITYKRGEYEVGVIEVGFTEPYPHFIDRMRQYQFVCTRTDDPLDWPVFVGGIKIFEHTKFKRPKVTGKSSRELDQWRHLPFSALTELPEAEPVPSAGDVDEEDVDKVAEPTPQGQQHVSEHERAVTDHGLINGKTLQEWALLGMALPMLPNYDNYPRGPYNMFCSRYRRVFSRARFTIPELAEFKIFRLPDDATCTNTTKQMLWLSALSWGEGPRNTSSGTQYGNW
ncbi:uncharacterized protein B0H18DRAFT_959595 [Fomitopsis serialis]|uniref:uncharacterized protein n=1 Tax=Fomitopsis serialis TaxID=139415 RepID=UPI0020087039|nr:uncharacterized protein B0H18DRAFT_959595 [Neoantrodia serialis]KAH9914859.1 hypothetical protein B0H18DRAFT_959595 [Neoantrodia serialis]